MSQIEATVPDDEELLQLIQEGNKPAFNVLFEKYWEKAYSEAYKRLKNQDNAKDIVQEIFVHIWVNRQTLRINNLSAYLHVSIRNKVINFVAKQKPIHPFFDNLENITEKNSFADADLLWKDFFNSYEALLNSLPPKRQIIFRLRYQEDVSTKEISKQLGVTQKTVQNQLGKAINTLKVTLLRILVIGLILYCKIHF
ncbi:MAG: sigma-70 family RNA polymerase sigma factor [Ginsengibacter sp.]